MGWERRGNRVYYYTAERVDGRVVKRYGGGGAAGELVARTEAIERDKRLADRERGRIARARAEGLDSALVELDGLVDLLSHAAMVAAGYHQHRGEWRKRRGHV